MTKPKDKSKELRKKATLFSLRQVFKKELKYWVVRYLVADSASSMDLREKMATKELWKWITTNFKPKEKTK